MAKPNVLFIVVDDLRTQLGCYGRGQTKSPHIDRLAAEGVVFERAYCQVPVCGASRASFLSGVRPTRDRFVHYHAKVDKDLPGARVLPQHFREAGYTTVSNGKVFHHRDDCRRAWSAEPWAPPAAKGNWRDYVLPENQAIAAASTKKQGCGPAWECAEVEDAAYTDGKLTERTLADLGRLAAEDAPFFLAAGYLKPHLPFNAPKRYWDLYRRDAVDLADNPFPPKDAPGEALHNWGELRAYHGIPRKGPVSEETARALVHGYYACTSYTDAQVGRLLDEVERLGIRDETIVVLWGDHGWQLGEHGLWCKHCNFDTSLHAPLIVSAPGMRRGARSAGIVEFVDVYPTLCELAGLALPAPLEGTSFRPLLERPDREWKEAAFSRYHAGDSVKTDRYLYTEWRDTEGRPTARMLYDHEDDPAENVNLADDPAHAADVAKLGAMLKAGWEAVRPA